MIKCLFATQTAEVDRLVASPLDVYFAFSTSTVIPQIGSVATASSPAASLVALALRTRVISAATLNAISGNVSLPSSTPAGHVITLRYLHQSCLLSTSVFKKRLRLLLACDQAEILGPGTDDRQQSFFVAISHRRDHDITGFVM